LNDRHFDLLDLKTPPKRRCFYCQIIRKPGSVLSGHLSSPLIARWIKRFIDALWRETISSRRERIHLLAAGRVYLFLPSPARTVSSYLTLFTLAPINRGGIVSVALSLRLPSVAVSNCHSLCCPDFPRTLRHAASR
jgi:hypothetical protein